MPRLGHLSRCAYFSNHAVIGNQKRRVATTSFLVICCLLLGVFADAQTCAVSISTTPPSPVVPGTNVTVNATASPSGTTGSVTLDSKTPPICSSFPCTTTLTSLTNGTHTLSWVCTTSGGSNSGSQPLIVDQFAKFELPFFVVSLIYDPPGNASSNGFTDSASDGTTATISASFAANDTESFMETDGEDFTFTQGESVSFTAMVGASASFQETLTAASGIQDQSVQDPVNHYQDRFWLWLNPRVTVTQTGTTTGNYSMGTHLDANGNPEPVDILDVTVAELLDPNQIPLDKLQPRIIDGFTVPGISSICKNQVACTEPMPADACPAISQKY
jgi:hypothetical protein